MSLSCVHSGDLDCREADGGTGYKKKPEFVKCFKTAAKAAGTIAELRLVKIISDNSTLARKQAKIKQTYSRMESQSKFFGEGVELHMLTCIKDEAQAVVMQ